jgi:thiosulfate dehydrogenase [quinone] large subunit
MTYTTLTDQDLDGAPLPARQTSTEPDRRDKAQDAGDADPGDDINRIGAGARYMWAVTRLTIGFVALWAFLDKLMGLDHATPGAKSWLNGVSPTTGFLKGVEGPFAGMFHSMAGATWADWLFMAGMAGIGIALILGIGLRIAAVSGVFLFGMLYLSQYPVEQNPFVDVHIVYIVVIIALALSNAGDTFGLGRRWKRTFLVRHAGFLR